MLCVFRPSSGCWRGEQERCACSCTSGRSVSVALSRARAERCRVGRETTDECVFLSATPTAYYICLCVLLYIGLSHVREYGSCISHLQRRSFAPRLVVRKSGSITIHMCPDRSVNLFFLIFYHLYHGEIRVGVRNGTRRMRARRAGHASLAISRSRAVASHGYSSMSHKHASWMRGTPHIYDGGLQSPRDMVSWNESA